MCIFGVTNAGVFANPIVCLAGELFDVLKRLDAAGRMTPIINIRGLSGYEIHHSSGNGSITEAMLQVSRAEVKRRMADGSYREWAKARDAGARSVPAGQAELF